MTQIHGMDDGHRRWAEVDGAHAQRDPRPPTGQTAQQSDAASWEPQGYGRLTFEILETLAAIEVPAEEEVAKSVAYVSERIASEAGAGLAAQANLQPANVLELLGG